MGGGGCVVDGATVKVIFIRLFVPAYCSYSRKPNQIKYKIYFLFLRIHPVAELKKCQNMF